MNIEITGRHVEITPALREFADEKLAQAREAARRTDRGPRRAGASRSTDTWPRSRSSPAPRCSPAREETERPVRLDRRGRGQARAPGAAAQGEGHDAQAASRSAQPRGGGGDRGQRVARGHGRAAVGLTTPPRIVRAQRYRLKPLTPEDAVLELDATAEDLSVYRDADTYRVNVVYRQRDGSFGPGRAGVLTRGPP